MANPMRITGCWRCFATAPSSRRPMAGGMESYRRRPRWQTGGELVSQLIADRVRQQDERERRVHLAQHNRSLFARRQAADSVLHAAQGLHGQATAQLAELETQRVALDRL